MKTGGTSLNQWIQRHYCFDDILFEASLWRELWPIPAAKLKQKRFIRGHFGSYIAHYFKPTEGFFYITLLRNPVERVVSHFWHVKRATDDRLYWLGSQPSFDLMDFLSTH